MSESLKRRFELNALTFFCAFSLLRGNVHLRCLEREYQCESGPPLQGLRYIQEYHSLLSDLRNYSLEIQDESERKFNICRFIHLHEGMLLRICSRKKSTWINNA